MSVEPDLECERMMMEVGWGCHGSLERVMIYSRVRCSVGGQFSRFPLLSSSNKLVWAFYLDTLLLAPTPLGFAYGVWGPQNGNLWIFFIRDAECMEDQYPNNSFTVMKKNKSDRVWSCESITVLKKNMREHEKRDRGSYTWTCDNIVMKPKWIPGLLFLPNWSLTLVAGLEIFCYMTHQD